MLPMQAFSYILAFFAVSIIKTGSSTRLVTVAVKRVTEVSHPSAKVPPKLLAQKMMNPAVSTSEV